MLCAACMRVTEMPALCTIINPIHFNQMFAVYLHTFFCITTPSAGPELMNEMTAQKLETATIELADRGYSVITDFLSPIEVQQVLAVLQQRIEDGEFKKAGIGAGNHFQVDKTVRGDYIRWIDRQDARMSTTMVLQRVDELRLTINRLCFLGLKDYEAHFAFYPTGTFYKRHLDQFKTDDHRRISFVIYLNEGWQTADGGQLRLFLPDEQTGAEQVVDIAPTAGTLAIFRSDIIEHEVLPVNRERYSITGWMLNQLLELTFLG